MPGLGADARFLAPQQSEFPDLLIPEWLPPAPTDSLATYAAKMAAAAASTTDDILGGVSFGGMLALEIARLTNPRAVILIATCRHPSAIAPAVRRFGQLGSRFMLPSAARRLAPLAIPILGPMRAEHRKLLTQMAETTPLDFLRWGAKAIFGWPGVESLSCPVLHIHGTKDRVIGCDRVQPNLTIRGGGHVVNLTHAPQVNEAIRAFMDRLAPAELPTEPWRPRLLGPSAERSPTLESPSKVPKTR